MKKAQLQRMIYEGLKPEMPELMVCHKMICFTPVNSILRGVILSPLARSARLLRVCTFARPLFCPSPGLMGSTALVAWGLLRFDVWDLDKLEDAKIFQKLLRLHNAKCEDSR